MKRTVTPDIFHLGFTVINKKISKELDKIFIEDDANPEGDNAECIAISELSELITIVSKLKERLTTVEKDVVNLTKQNKSLQDQISTHRCGGETCNSGTNPSNSTHQVTQTGSVIPVRDESSPSSEDESNAEQHSTHQFQFPQKYIHKMKKLEKKVPKKSRPTPKPLAAADGDVPTLRAMSPTSSPTMFHLYVGKVHTNSSENEVSAQLTGMGISSDHHKVESLTRSDSAKWRSFKVSVPSQHQDTVLSRDNWPNGLILQPFRNKQRDQFRNDRTGNRHKRTTNKSHQRGHSGSQGRSMLSRTNWSTSSRHPDDYHYYPYNWSDDHYYQRQPSYSSGTQAYSDSDYYRDYPAISHQY